MLHPAQVLTPAGDYFPTRTARNLRCPCNAAVLLAFRVKSMWRADVDDDMGRATNFAEG